MKSASNILFYVVVSLFVTIILFMENQYLLIIWAILFIFLGFADKILDLNKNAFFPRKIVIPILSSFIPILLLWTLYHNVLDNWWLMDDPCHLFYISQNGIFPAFFDNTRGFSPINFTPWLPLSYGMDLGVFGFNPSPFYWHQLISISIALLLAYIVLVRFFSPFITAFILSLFVTSVPMCDCANLLMNRHYIEGLSFVLISLHFFFKASEKNNVSYLYGSAFFYLLACLAKEVYVPLIFIMIVFPFTEIRKRLRLIYPFLIVAVIYTIWRFHMLNTSGMLSAYPHIPVTYKDIFYLPLSIIKTMGWNSVWQLISISVMLVAFLFFVLKNKWRDNLVILLFTLCVVLPILPVSSISSTSSSRYLFVFSFLFFIGMGLGIKYIYGLPFLKTFRNEIIIFLGVVSLIISVSHIQNKIIGWQLYGKEISVEGKFLLYNDDPENLLLTSHGHCYWAFSALRQTLLGLPQGASYCVNDCLCSFIYPDKKAWINMDGQLFINNASMEAKTSEDCGEKRDLSIYCSYVDGRLKWKFGPYNVGGRYLLFLKGWDSGLIQVKREAEIEQKFDLDSDFIIVKYESYQGWKTYSPVLKFKMMKSHDMGIINWQR